MRSIMTLPFGSLFDDLLTMENRTSMLGWDYFDDNENYYLKAVIPGYQESELNILTKGNRLLTVTGKHEKTDNKSKKFFVNEQSSFEKTYQLPQDVLVESIQAEYKSGILVITLPKRKASQLEVKSIPIAALNK